DDEPRRFLAYLLAALQTLDPRIGLDAGVQLEALSATDLEAILAPLINDLDRYPTDVTLVLDDYHVLEDAATQAALVFLLEHLPERLHLALGARVDPPLPLARLRARGQLCELRAETLRFTPAEVRSFLRKMDLDLAEEALNSLEEQTEGWVAG